MLERMWAKGNVLPLLMAVQIGTVAWKSVWQFLRTLGNNLPQDPVVLCWVYTQTMLNHTTKTHS